MEWIHHIENYFRRMYTNDEILAALAEEPGIVLSRRTLERSMQRKGLWRRKEKADMAEVSAFIEAQLQTSGQCHGYRWMHQKCWMNGIVTDRETVRVLMQLQDTEGVQLRTRHRLRRRVYHSRGPNYVWHIDGYDKLKPFGIAISGCIDGFSRKLIWLQSYKTNNDPEVIAGYFMDAVLSTEGCPDRVRLDMGTENVRLAEMQNFLHWSEGQVTTADHVTFGPSTGNQRIERWWLTLRSQCAQFWMDIFDKLRCDGHFADTFLDKSLVQFCFLSIIQEELDTVAATWNEHRIRRVHASRSPHGRPAIMYLLPELYGARDCKHCPGLDKIEACLEECVFKNFPCDEDVFHVCVDLMSEHNLSFTSDVFETVNLYITLREHINRELNSN